MLVANIKKEKPLKHQRRLGLCMEVPCSPSISSSPDGERCTVMGIEDRFAS